MEGTKLDNKYAYIKDGKVFLKGYLDMPDRQIGEVKRTEEEAFAYFVNRYQIAENKVNQLETEITEAQNKGSFLTKLTQLRKRLLSFDGIGDFMPLLEKLDTQETFLRSLIVDNQANNLIIKQDLLEEVRTATISTEWQKVADELQEIKTRWIRTGPVEKEHQEETENTFRDLLDGFFMKRKSFYEEQNRVINERIDKYEALVQTAFQLHRMGDFDKAFAELKRVQQEWKLIGEIPPKKLKQMFKTFKKSTTTFYEKYCRFKGIQPPKPRLDPRIEMQMKMVEEVESLSKQKDIFAAADRTKVLLNDWKNIKVPSHIADRTLSDRFRHAADKIFELSYLMKVISRKYPTFDYLSESQQNLAKFREMENIVRRSKGELQMLIESFDAVPRNYENDKIMQSNISTQKRKLGMKEFILNELERLT